MFRKRLSAGNDESTNSSDEFGAPIGDHTAHPSGKMQPVNAGHT